MTDRSQSQRSLRITRTLTEREARWDAALELLSSRHKLPSADAEKLLRRFLKRLQLAFNPAWFINPRLTKSENLLVVALCEVHGADAVDLHMERKVAAGTLKLSYAQTVRFEPGWGKGHEEEGRAAASITFSVLGKTFTLRTAAQVLTVQALLFACAACTYAVFAAAFFYGLATVGALVRHPAALTMAATRRLDLLLGLLCFLVGTAGVLGKAIRSTFMVVIRRVRRSAAVAS